MKYLIYSVRTERGTTAPYSNKAEAIHHARALAADGWPTWVRDDRTGQKIWAHPCQRKGATVMWQQVYTSGTTVAGRMLVTISTGTQSIRIEFLTRKDACEFLKAYRKSTSRKCRRFVS